MAHATVPELVNHLGRTPANAERLLDRASRDVDSALLCAVYDPEDQDVIDALKEATLEQVAANLDAGNTTGNGATRASSFTIGKLSVQRAAAAASEGGPARVGRLWEQAWLILQAAGLTGFGPQTW